MQAEVENLEDEIAEFNVLVNQTVDRYITQVPRCTVSVSPAVEVSRRQGSSSSFSDNFFKDTRDNAYKLYGQYADLRDIF